MTPATVERLFWGAVALVAVSIGIAAGPLPWRLAGESGLPEPERPPAGASPAARVSLDPILALNPFGRAVAPDMPAEIEETSLGLTLRGVVIAEDPAASSAILSPESGPTRTYGVGDAVGAEATLAEVHADRVVLEASGRREILSFPEADDTAATPDRGTDALRALVDAQDSSPGTDAPAAEAGGGDVVADLHERFRDNPQRVLDDLGLTASGAGYAVGDAPAEAVLRAGLRPGDVVATVNGQQVGNIEQDRRLFDEVAASDRVRIEVLRDEQHIVLSFPLR